MGQHLFSSFRFPLGSVLIVVALLSLCRRTVLSLPSSGVRSAASSNTIFQPPIHPYQSSEAAPCPKQHHEVCMMAFRSSGSRHSQAAFPATTFDNASSAGLQLSVWIVTAISVEQWEFLISASACSAPSLHPAAGVRCNCNHSSGSRPVPQSRQLPPLSFSYIPPDILAIHPSAQCCPTAISPMLMRVVGDGEVHLQAREVQQFIPRRA